MMHGNPETPPLEGGDTTKSQITVLRDLHNKISAKDVRISRLEEALRKALKYQVANENTPYEYYQCKTPETMPAWVLNARRVLEVEKWL